MLKDAYNWEHRLKMERQRLSGEFIKKDDGINLSDKDRELIIEFIDDCRAGGLSNARIVNYMRVLRLSKRFLPKNFIDVKKADMKKAIAKLEESNLKEWSKQAYKIAFKKFYRWLYVEKFNEKLKRKEYPEVVEWFETTMKKDKLRLPEDILTEEDIQKLLSYCNNVRDKAFVSLLWDSGCRVGEVLNLKIKHFVPDEHGATIVVYGKTGSRRVRLIPSVPYLSNWKENHPTRDNPNSYLFVGIGTRNKGKRIGYNTADTMLRKLNKRAKINKKCNAHSFRHARATYFSSRVKEAVLKESFGWTQKSQMVGIYTHLSGREVDKEIRKAQGIVDNTEKEEESKLIPIKCPRCKHSNESTSKYCSKCSMVLDPKEAIKLEERRNRVDKDLLSEALNINMELFVQKLIESGQAKELIKKIIRNNPK